MQFLKSKLFPALSIKSIHIRNPFYLTSHSCTYAGNNIHRFVTVEHYKSLQSQTQ